MSVIHVKMNKNVIQNVIYIVIYLFIGFRHKESNSGAHVIVHFIVVS